MPKYWGKQIFAHGRFPKVGRKQKTERKRLNDGNNSSQLRMAHASTHGARKPPGPKLIDMSSKKMSRGKFRVQNHFCRMKGC